MSGVIWVCNACGKQLKSDNERAKHRSETNPPHDIYTPISEDQEISTCNKCGMTFRSKINRELHDGLKNCNKQKEEEISFFCHKCSKSFHNLTDKEKLAHVEQCKGPSTPATVIAINDDVIEKIANRIVKKLIEREIEVCDQLNRLSLKEFKKKYHIPDT